jgi:hypothetical protein
MAATISLELRERFLRCYFMPDTFMRDEQLFVAVTGKVPLANQSGLTIDEPAAGAYGRAAISLNSEWWALSGFGEVSTIADIDFPAPEDGEDWGYLQGWALLDAPDSGLTLAVGSLIQPMTFTADQPPLSIGPGGIVLGLFD